MAHKKSVALVFTALVAGVGIARLVKRRSSQMPGLSAWQGVLAEKQGEFKAQQLVEQIRQRYATLLSDYPLPDNPILCRHATENILPGLALYQTLLQEHGGDRQAALEEVDAAFRAWAIAKNRLLIAPLKILPLPFELFQLVFAQTISHRRLGFYHHRKQRRAYCFQRDPLLLPEHTDCLRRAGINCLVL
jgi:hypothetical protein